MSWWLVLLLAWPVLAILFVLWCAIVAGSRADREQRRLFDQEMDRFAEPRGRVVPIAQAPSRAIRRLHDGTA